MTPRIGSVLDDRYELTDFIAFGGMGEVWKGTDHKTGRDIAVKVLKETLLDDERYYNRFNVEGLNASKVRHPGVIRVLSTDTSGPYAYIVMEYINGRTLAELLREEGSLSPEDLLPILIQAANGLEACHQAGVVHRDVKPSNLMLTPRGVKITDFGVSLGINQAAMTAAGNVMGTAHYLPPEQTLGKQATAAGDVYALGIVAYECLVGNRPYTGTNQVDIAFAHVNEPLPPLPEEIPETLRDLVERMLSKDPQERPASAHECALELEVILDQIRPPGVTHTLSRSLQRASIAVGNKLMPVDSGSDNPLNKPVFAGLAVGIIVVALLLGTYLGSLWGASIKSSLTEQTSVTLALKKEIEGLNRE